MLLSLCFANIFQLAFLITECSGLEGTSGSSSPTPLPKQGHPEQAAQDLIQVGLNISREGDTTAPLGSLFQGSVTLTVKKFFLLFSQNVLCFSLCLLPLVLSLGPCLCL